MTEILHHWLDLILGRNTAEDVLASFGKFERRLQRLTQREEQRIAEHEKLKRELQVSIALLDQDVEDSSSRIQQAQNARQKLQSFLS